MGKREICPPCGFNLEEDLALVLTATIDIKGMPKAYPTVPEQRQEDYCRALQYYVQNHSRIRKIIFIENSGWPLEQIQRAIAHNPYHKQVEFISLNCNNFPRTLGKGYGECLLIEKGLEKSELINSVSYFAKLTGRIYLRNLTEILESVRNPYACLCDFNEHGWLFKKLLGDRQVGPHVDTRFLVFHKDFFEQYIKILHWQHRQGCQDCFYIETKFYKAIKSAAVKEKVIYRFPIEPIFDGIAGHFQGKNYSSREEMIKFYIRSLTRKFLPVLSL
jgi:hypothetical protein